MIERYTLPEMGAVWSEERKLALWKEIETLAAEAGAALEIAPAEVATALRAAPEVDPELWRARESVTHHDLAAFVDVLADSAAGAAGWVHYGLTSSDVLDTATAVMMHDAAGLLVDRLRALFDVVRRRAEEHRATAMIGRTHGIWAEPTTFGLKLAGWAFEVERAHRRMTRARETAAVGKISGAVGTYAHTPPAVEEYICSHLGLGVEPASTQVTARDRHAEYLTTIALVGGTLERFATEIRLLQRSEVSEVWEAFGDGQKGSSAMPHKRNPIASENLTGIARLLRGYASAGLEDVALWHERDISHSSVERVALPDASILLDFALARMTTLIDALVVDVGRMLSNLDGTNGMVYSQAVLLALVERGIERDEAYRLVSRNAVAAWEAGESLRDHLAADAEVGLSDHELDRCFSVERFLENSGVVFERLEAVRL